MSEPLPSSPELGSLAQAARGGQLKQARVILLVIGILTILANAVIFAASEQMVHSELDKLIAQKGLAVDPAERAELEAKIVRINRLFAAGAIGLGSLFVVFGLFVSRYPVPITVVSLVLYVGSAAVFGFLDPTTLAQGLIIKIIIVVFLLKAVKSAIAYEKARSELEFESPQALRPLE